MYALMYPILYIASIHCYIPLSTATSMSVCSVCIVLWHDHVNGEIKALKKNIYIYFSIGSDNGLAPARRQAIIWTNYG